MDRAWYLYDYNDNEQDGMKGIPVAALQYIEIENRFEFVPVLCRAVVL